VVLCSTAGLGTLGEDRQEVVRWVFLGSLRNAGESWICGTFDFSAAIGSYAARICYYLKKLLRSFRYMKVSMVTETWRRAFFTRYLAT